MVLCCIEWATTVCSHCDDDACRAHELGDLAVLDLDVRGKGFSAATRELAASCGVWVFGNQKLLRASACSSNLVWQQL